MNHASGGSQISALPSAFINDSYGRQVGNVRSFINGVLWALLCVNWPSRPVRNDTSIASSQHSLNWPATEFNQAPSARLVSMISDATHETAEHRASKGGSPLSTAPPFSPPSVLWHLGIRKSGNCGYTVTSHEYKAVANRV